MNPVSKILGDNSKNRSRQNMMTAYKHAKERYGLETAERFLNHMKKNHPIIYSKEYDERML